MALTKFIWLKIRVSDVLLNMVLDRQVPYNAEIPFTS